MQSRLYRRGFIVADCTRRKTNKFEKLKTRSVLPQIAVCFFERLRMHPLLDNGGKIENEMCPSTEFKFHHQRGLNPRA